MCGCNSGGVNGTNKNINYKATGNDGKDLGTFKTSAEAKTAIQKNGGGSLKPVKASV